MEELHSHPPAGAGPAVPPPEAPDGLAPAGRAGEPEPAPGLLELIAGVLFRPRSTYLAAARRPPLGAALLVVALVSTLGAVAAGGGPGAILRAAGRFAGTLAWLALLAAVLGLAAELTGGRGRILTLFTLLALSRAPALLALPLVVAGKAAPLAGALAGGGARLWTLVLTGYSIWAAYRTSGPRAAAAVVLALGAAIFVPLVLLILGVLALMSRPEVWRALQQIPQF